MGLKFIGNVMLLLYKEKTSIPVLSKQEMRDVTSTRF